MPKPDAFTLIYSDGACSGNPGPGGWGAIVLTPDHQVSELGGSDFQTTNNRMELMGAIVALEHVASTPGPVIFYTDSTYVIRGITQWIWAWKRRNWVNSQNEPVLNQDLWETLHRLILDRGRDSTVDWRYIRGHTGDPGNERCDQIAVLFSQGQAPRLFEGHLKDYAIDLTQIPKSEPLPEMKNHNGSKASKKPLSYLSLIGGTAVRHSTWTDCERRVKGQSGAKFKKAMSQAEELEILKSWGVSPDKLKTE